jgi:hypothetical protein
MSTSFNPATYGFLPSEKTYNTKDGFRRLTSRELKLDLIFYITRKLFPECTAEEAKPLLYQYGNLIKNLIIGKRLCSFAIDFMLLELISSDLYANSMNVVGYGEISSRKPSVYLGSRLKMLNSAAIKGNSYMARNFRDKFQLYVNQVSQCTYGEYVDAGYFENMSNMSSINVAMLLEIKSRCIKYLNYRTGSGAFVGFYKLQHRVILESTDFQEQFISFTHFTYSDLDFVRQNEKFIATYRISLLSACKDVVCGFKYYDEMPSLVGNIYHAVGYKAKIDIVHRPP